MIHYNIDPLASDPASPSLPPPTVRHRHRHSLTEEAVLTMKIEEKTRRNKNYLRETLVAPPRRKVRVDMVDIHT